MTEKTHTSNDEQLLTKTSSSKITTGSENNQTGSKNPPPKPRGSSGIEEVELRRPFFSSSYSSSPAQVVNGRERLERHRAEVAGRVWVPDVWGHEELLKDWMDCTAFDASLVNSQIMSARAALVGGRIRANSRGIRIENRC